MCGTTVGYKPGSTSKYDLKETSTRGVFTDIVLIKFTHHKDTNSIIISVHKDSPVVVLLEVVGQLKLAEERHWLLTGIGMRIAARGERR